MDQQVVGGGVDLSRSGISGIAPLMIHKAGTIIKSGSGIQALTYFKVSSFFSGIKTDSPF